VSWLVYGLTSLAAYLLGSLPTGFLVAKAKGMDIRTVGSGNIGATNVFRSLGLPAGLFVLLVDAAKGWVAVRLLANWVVHGLLPPDAVGGAAEVAAIIAGLAVILGHNYTCWLGFKGGKGIATSAGVLAGLVPLPLLVIMGVWLLVFLLTRYVSLASICAAFALPFATWALVKRPALIFVTLAMAVLAIYKHKANIQRLLAGTEHRLGVRRTQT